MTSDVTFFCYGLPMRADRLLSILLLLQSGGRMTARVLAQRLECSERTILRDMDALSGAGVPVTAERGVGGGWRLLDGYQTKLTGLNAAEIQSLFLARPPKLMADLGLKQAAEGAWLKLQAALPIEMRAQAEFVRQRILVDARAWRDPGESITSLPVVLESLWRGRRLRFDYAPSGEATGERIVDPLGLVARGSVWYLVADRGEQRRTYRVSRIRAAAVLAEPSRRPAGFDLAEHWERAATEFRDRLPRFYATLLAARDALPRLRYYGRRVEEEANEGERVRVRVRFDAEEEALQFALALGASVEVLEPPALRERVLAVAEVLVRRYAAPAAAVSLRP
jgi:predicted DNA-binding transcriptional regulator YafY